MPEPLRHAVIFGATSAIAEQTARILAARGAALFLVARDRVRLATICDDLGVRGAARVGHAGADLDDLSRHRSLLEAARASLGAIDLIVVAHGVLADSEACERDVAVLERLLVTNFVGAASLCQAAAGDRARASNYGYGASKGALSMFLDGLRSRFHRRGVWVITVKPGRVDTPMTAHLPATRLSVSPAVVARAIVRAAERRTPVVYVPGFWRPIMFVIRHLPGAIMRRMRF